MLRLRHPPKSTQRKISKKIADNFFDNATYITLLHPSQGTGAYVKERTTKLDEYEHSLIGEDGDSVYGFVTGTDDEEVDFITNEEYLVVAVTPSGVDSVVNINQMEVDEIVNSDVEIMSFEEINKIAQEKMKSKELDTGYNQDIEVSDIKLALAQVEKDGSYDIVPAWYYMFDLPDQAFPIKNV